MTAAPYRIAVDRPVSAEERSLIEWLLEHGDGDNTEFIAQVDHARVIAHCSCGCASIDVAIAGKCPSEPLRVLADFQWTTRHGHLCGAFVFEHGGLLGGLDLWSVDGESVPSILPAVEDLAPFGAIRST
ncbi:MAG TPA: hypothetical protein VIT62_12530 [Lysobacter sp.]